MDWRTRPKEEVVEWLLEGEPWTVYRTLTDLLDEDKEHKAVVSVRMAIPEHQLVKKIFDGLNKEGYWGNPKDIHTWWPKKILLSGFSRCLRISV